MTENSTDFVHVAVAHELTQGAVRTAVETVKGRVGRRTQPYEDSFASAFRDFARAVVEVTLVDDSVNLDYVVKLEEGWRQKLAAENENRLREIFAIDAVIERYAVSICEQLNDVAPPLDFMRQALRTLFNVCSQVARLVRIGVDPLSLLVPTTVTSSGQRFTERSTEGN